MKKRYAIAAVASVAGLLAYSPTKQWLSDNQLEVDMYARMIQNAVQGTSETEPTQASSEPTSWYQEEAADSQRTDIERDGSIRPFKNIGDSLDELSQHFDTELLMTQGAVIFDANGDGLLDMYIPSVQRTVAVKTDENHVLTTERVPAKPSSLFLNMGPNDQGEPVYKSIQALLAERQGSGPQQRVREELIIEGKYQPRESVSDDPHGVGRISRGAIAADFNGDGRLDLYVLNGHFGLPYQTADLGFPIYPAGKNIGRDSAAKPLLLRSARFMRTDIEDGKDVVLNYGPQEEAEGRNTLYLNLGDRDNDGIPEWQDVTHTSGVGGRWSTVSAAVSDFDRDGDIDIYVANFQDPDFIGFGATKFSGQPNQLYKNLLTETGELKFEDVSKSLQVAGFHDEEDLASDMFFSGTEGLVGISDQEYQGSKVGEKADHSWSALFYDWNTDGWDDLVVANDMGNRLRVYRNLAGKGFEYMKEFDDLKWEGCWMGLSRGDLDGDQNDELLATNCGSQSLSIQNTRLLFQQADPNERSVMANTAISYALGKNTLHHQLLSYSEEEGFQSVATDVEVKHSAIIPPDQTLPQNILPDFLPMYEKYRFAESLTGIEFAFSAPMFDVDNDGDLDIYFVGALARGNDGHFGDFSGNPGRLLVNESRIGELSFTDKSVDYQLLDINGIDYDHSPPRRKAPGTGWHKRDYIYIDDTSSYAGMGLEASESKISDMLRMHEHGSTVLPADLNNDGFLDIVVTHLAGYNSNSPDARNLKVSVMGRTMAVPGISKLTRPLTSYEYGKLSMYINGGAPKDRAGNWVKISLSDRTGFNRYAIGSRLLVNDKTLRHMEATNGVVGGSVHQDIHVGLDDQGLNTIKISWGSGDQTQTLYQFDQVTNQRICIDRQQGVIDCQDNRLRLGQVSDL